MHDGGAGLVVLALGNPHLLEGGQGRQDGASDPDRVLALGRRHHLAGTQCLNTNKLYPLIQNSALPHASIMACTRDSHLSKSDRC